MFFHASHEEKDVTNHFFGEVSCQDTTKLYKKGPLSAASANFPFCFYSAHFCFLLPLSFVVSSPICVNNTKSFLCTMWFLSRPNNFLKFFIRCKKQFNDFFQSKTFWPRYSFAIAVLQVTLLGRYLLLVVGLAARWRCWYSLQSFVVIAEICCHCWDLLSLLR